MFQLQEECVESGLVIEKDEEGRKTALLLASFFLLPVSGFFFEDLSSQGSCS